VQEGFVRAPFPHRSDSHILKPRGDLAEVERAQQRSQLLVAITHRRTTNVTAGHRPLNPVWPRPRTAPLLGWAGARPPECPRRSAPRWRPAAVEAPCPPPTHWWLPPDAGCAHTRDPRGWAAAFAGHRRHAEM